MNLLFPSLNHIVFDRSPPATGAEAEEQAAVLHRRFQTVSSQSYSIVPKIFTQAISFNNLMVDAMNSCPNRVLGLVAGSLSLVVYRAPLPQLVKIAVVVAGTPTVYAALSRIMQTRAPVLGAYKKEMDALVRETKALCQKDAFTAIDTLTHLKTPFFYQQVCTALRQDLITTPLSKRFVYEICWNNQVTGILIGTCHAHTQAVALDPVLHNTVRKCRGLVTEVGLMMPLGTLAGKICFNQLSYFSYHMDTALVFAAIRHHIPVEALETIEQQQNFRKALFIQQGEWSTDTDESARVINAFYQLPMQEQILMAQLAYITADSKKMVVLASMHPDLHKMLYTDRNYEWLHGKPQLLQRLQSSNTSAAESQERVWIASDRILNQDKPLCIAVGVGHCLGSDGLVLQLRKNGFTVTKME